MNAIQHEQSQFDDPSFPILLHEDELNAQRRSVYTNWHSAIELLYGLEGAANIVLDSETVPFCAGQIIIIGSNVMHTIRAVSTLCRYQCLIISADFLAAHELHTAHMRFISPVQDRESLLQFQQIIDEYQAQGPFYRAAVMAAALTLFVRLLRHHARPDRGIQQHMEGKYPLTVMRALYYIRVNLCEAISIDDICRHVGMSKYYFCRMFKAYTGMPVIRYINMLRCDYAQKLITEKGCNVTEAAQTLGIHNLPYFSRLYKRHTGVTPSKMKPERR